MVTLNPLLLPKSVTALGQDASYAHLLDRYAERIMGRARNPADEHETSYITANLDLSLAFAKSNMLKGVRIWRRDNNGIHLVIPVFKDKRITKDTCCGGLVIVYLWRLETYKLCTVLSALQVRQDVAFAYDEVPPWVKALAL